MTEMLMPLGTPPVCPLVVANRAKHTEDRSLEACHEGEPGLPVRPAPYPDPGAHAALARRRGPVRLELGPGQMPGTVWAERVWYSAVDMHKLWNAEKKADPAPGQAAPSAST